MKSKPIRLTTTSYAVMSLLEMLGAATPYDLKQALEHGEDRWRGAEATLVGGIAYHRQMLETFGRFVSSREG